jgi:hypothetical protein
VLDAIGAGLAQLIDGVARFTVIVVVALAFV